MPNADSGVAVPHPESYFRGSTSGMGGASSEVHERYDATPTHHFRMQPGSKMFTKHYKAREIGPEGTWGQAVYRKYNPVKQMGGAAGYLNQDPRSYIPSRDMPARSLGRVVNSQFLPRGGSVPRVVGSGGGDTDEFYDDGSGMRLHVSDRGGYMNDVTNRRVYPPNRYPNRYPFNNVSRRPPPNADMTDRRNAQVPGQPAPESDSPGPWLATPAGGTFSQRVTLEM
jgi:hypothetical protein